MKQDLEAEDFKERHHARRWGSHVSLSLVCSEASQGFGAEAAAHTRSHAVTSSKCDLMTSWL